MEETAQQNAVLVTVATDPKDAEIQDKSLTELSALLETAGGHEVARFIQIKDKYDPRTCIGKGKVSEIRDFLEKTGTSLVIFDFDLTPAQIRNLTEDLAVERVIDRSMLILDIFALHAVTGEGKLQVELAQLKYTAPRLAGHGKELSRLGGGIGTRGPGESKLETDRRRLKERENQLERELEELAGTRRVIRGAREKSGIPSVAIVGYTNAGKSTLLNALTDAGVLSENKLFATLDPTTRKLTLPGGTDVLVTDTVGFIRKLPHHLIHAFRSTLEEAVFADLLIIVSDVSDEAHEEHIAVTEELLRELGAESKPRIYLYNKCDLLPDFPENGFIRDENKIYISADKKQGLDLLLSKIEKTILAGSVEKTYLFPYDAQAQLNRLYRDAKVLSTDYEDGGVRVRVTLDKDMAGRYAAYEVL